MHLICFGPVACKEIDWFRRQQFREVAHFIYFWYSMWISCTEAASERFVFFAVKRDIQECDEEAVRVKEQSILELGGLLAKTGQAAGEYRSGSK